MRTNAGSALHSSEHRGNFSFDEENQINVMLPVEYSPDGSLKRVVVKDVTLLRDSSTTAGYTYLGFAPAGSNTPLGKASAIWKIIKVADSAEDAKTYAGGTTEYNQVWNNRASLSYS